MMDAGAGVAPVQRLMAPSSVATRWVRPVARGGDAEGGGLVGAPAGTADYSF